MLTAMLAAALTQTAPEAAADLSWIAGYWLDCSGDREVSETWSDPRGGLTIGHGVTIESRRTSFEFAHIRETAQGLVYVAQPGGSAPTSFLLSESAPNRVVFANAENDFPTRIVYERSGDALKARIEGEIGGEARSMEWNFVAAPLNARCPA